MPQASRTRSNQPAGERDISLRGTRPELPFRIMAYPASNSFGDFIMSLFYANTIAAQFDHARICVAYELNTEFKRPLATLVPNATRLEFPAGTSAPTLDLLNANAASRSPDELRPWFAGGFAEHDMVVIDSMTTAPTLSSFERLGHLSIPADVQPAPHERLTALGLKDSRWYCCIHYREPGYKHKPEESAFRDSKPDHYLELTTHIIEVLGGQVVRLGHPEMTPFPARPGFVDLSRLPDSVMLQAYAMSRARFALCGPSGPTSLATALDVPLGHTDAVDCWAAVHRHDSIRTVDVVLPDGSVLNQQGLFETGLGKADLWLMVAQGRAEIRKNPPSELIRMARYLMDVTANVTGWREPGSAMAGPAPNRLEWPRRPVFNFHFL